MQQFEGFKKSGIFTLSNGTEVHGELSLKGGATTLDLFSDVVFDTHGSTDIFGIFHDKTKVSLINCITTSGPGSGMRNGEHYHFSTVFPHFVVFSDQYINSSDRKISELGFVVDDASVLFYDFYAFGTVIDARPHMERIVETQEHGSKIEIGEYPHPFYFSGKHEIFVADTALGKISAMHGFLYSSPGPDGIHVKNTIRLNMAFKSEKTIKEAIISIYDVLRFLEVIAGRPQNITKLALISWGVEGHKKLMDVYWCMPPKRIHEDKSREPHPSDLPIQAGIKPNQFADVLSAWLERNETWRNARDRLSTALAYQNTYGIDRIVGSANMFDILPPSASPATVELDSDLKQARDGAIKAFRDLPESPERNSVLGALGRIGKASLKRKIRSRAKLITDVVGHRFPDLDLVVDQAVDCRNYYVHGSDAKVDYGMHSDLISFFSDTLEFIFAASDLLESGWDIAAWIQRGSTLSHPFGRFCGNYNQELSRLKEVL